MNHIGKVTMLAAAGGLRFWPETASTTARQVDLVYMALLGLLLFFVLLIGALALGYGVKYSAGSDAFRDDPIRRRLLVEIIWIGLPALITLGIFVWGARVFVRAATPPANARTIYVVGKQWMWKIQHPGGRREINELHVPVGEPIRLVMTSQDVIHSFYVPAFRVKQDVLPDRYTTLWFQATKTGEFRLECAEYCGANHAQMRGRVVVMEPARFQAWLESVPPNTGGFADTSADWKNSTSTAEAKPAFVRFGCGSCHQDRLRADVPALADLFGRRVSLRGGRTETVDENYIRRAILDPNAEIPAGYSAPSIMPTYKGQVNADDMIELIEGIKSMTPPSASGNSK